MAKRRVALLIEWSRAYGRGILRGISAYLRTHQNWTIFHTERSLSDPAPAWLSDWRGDGIIARIESPQLLTQIRRFGVPTVDLFDAQPASGIPKILTNDQTVARIAADHLVERGLRHFAYCGLQGIQSSEVRQKHFVEYLAQSGCRVNVYENPRQPHTAFISASEDYELLCEEVVAAWIDSLPKPVGLFACNDLRAHQILMACSDRNIAVPDEVAVLGVDNDEMICELCQPPLSSIELSPEKIGYEAAVTLDQLMSHQAPEAAKTFIEPQGLVTRQSTDVVAVADADLAVAIHFIRQHACEGIHVGDIIRHVGLSRSTLERRFAKVLGRSLKAEIVRVRLNRTKQLLTMTDYPLDKIAQLAGFNYVEGMCYLFKKTVGQTPGQYRKEAQAETGP